MAPKIAGTKAPFIETQFEVSLGLSVFDVVRVFLNSLNGSSWFKLPVKVTFEMKPGVEGEWVGGGEVGAQHSFIHGGSEVQTLTLLYTIFDRKDTPFIFFP